MAETDALPKKLKNDAIVEALLEIRYECDDLSPTVTGKLTDVTFCTDFQKGTRLPAADIPDQIRDQDPQLAFQPLIDRRNATGTKAIRIGPKVLSVHYYAPYPGWDSIEGELNLLIDELFSKLAQVRVLRLGLRYINILSSRLHLVQSAADLALSATVAGKPLTALNVTYPEHEDANHTAIVRVATPQFVQAAEGLPDDMAVAIDVDVFSPNGLEEQTARYCKQWVHEAHLIEKSAFFGLIPPEITKRLAAE